MGTDKRREEGCLVLPDAAKALAQGLPITGIAAGVTAAFQAHRERKQLQLLEAIVGRHDDAIKNLGCPRW